MLCFGLSLHGAQRTPIQRAIAVLRRFGTNAHVYLPGVGMLNGLQAGNYLDSAGTTPGAVDQPVGLALSAAGTTLEANAANYATATSFDNTTTKLSTTSFTATGATTATRVATDITGVTTGKTYELIFRVVAETQSGIVAFARAGAGGAGATISSTSSSTTGTTARLVFVATGAATSILWVGSAASGGSMSIDNIFVREVTGIHASQATAANRPILRRGAVNLGLSSHDVTNVGVWQKASGALTPSANTITFPAQGALLIRNVALPAPVGSVATSAIVLSGTGTMTFGLCRTAGGAYEESLKRVTLTSTPTCYTTSLTIANTGQTGFTDFITRHSGSLDTATEVTVSGAALFQGTYTAAQIQALGGIPLTTTAPASTALGPYSWDTSGGKSFAATFPAGNESVTVIDARPTGQVTATAQDVKGSLNAAISLDPSIVTGDNSTFAASVGTWKIPVEGGWRQGSLNATDAMLNAVNPSAVAITSATWAAGVVTVVTTAAHNYQSGEMTRIVGFTPTAYNGFFTVTVVDAVTLTYSLAADPGVTTVIGTLTSGAIAELAIPTVAGQRYALRFTGTQAAFVSVASVANAGSGGNILGQNSTTVGLNQLVFVAIGAISYLNLYRNQTPNASASWSTVTVRPKFGPINGKIIVNGALTAPDLLLLQRFANRMAGL